MYSAPSGCGSAFHRTRRVRSTFTSYPMPAIAPSILAADFSRLGELVKLTEAGGADRVHVDVMDGHFVPNLSMGSVVVKGLRPVTKLPLEVHLMVADPAQFVEGF